MKLPYLLFLLLTINLAYAQTIPQNRLTDWSNPGYRGTGALNAPIVDVTTLGIIGDSITDNSSLLNSIIANAAGNRTVLYFPAGIYLFNNTITLRDSIVLRGADAVNTKLRFNFNGSSGNGISISGRGNSTWYPVTDGYQQGNSWVVVADSGLITPGDWAEIREQNGTWDTQPISWADNSIGQLIQIISRSGDTLFFDKALRISYDAAMQVSISKFTPIKEAGVECLSYERKDSVNCFCPSLSFYHAVDCWVRGVEGQKSISAHVLLESSSNISISGCYFHHAFAYDGVSMHGYGLALYYHTGQCLIENNIFKHLRHSLSFQCGANGNVVSYNYSLDPNRSETPANYGADISMHGHYPYANLFEGNIVQNIQLDQTWGPNGRRNTFFRNRAALYGILMTSGTVNADSQIFAGNEVTSTALFQGNYTLAGAGHYEYGNSIRGVIMPSGTGNLTDHSLYPTSPPLFWNQGTTWPSLGTPNTANTGSNPAKDRYASGINLATCQIYSPSTGIENLINQEELTVFPNPTSGSVQIKLDNSFDYGNYEVADLTGRICISGKISNPIYGILNLDLTSLSSGTYFVHISGKQKLLTAKIILN